MDDLIEANRYGTAVNNDNAIKSIYNDKFNRFKATYNVLLFFYFLLSKITSLIWILIMKILISNFCNIPYLINDSI
jgi:hypothetical protein